MGKERRENCSQVRDEDFSVPRKKKVKKMGEEYIGGKFDRLSILYGFLVSLLFPFQRQTVPRGA